ncbi:MAG: hypothetical protein JWP01_3470 [Myxococcales bacterium]|nr:hypothetical protein [Myxococcales bacterium]
MKLSSLSTALLVLATACGTVVDPTGPGTGSGSDDPTDPGTDPDAPEAEAPLMIEAPKAATTPESLFTMTMVGNSPVIDLLRPAAGRRVDIVEQRIIQKTTDAVTLTIDVTRPTGMFKKTVVDDFVKIGTGTVVIDCVEDDTNPRCNEQLVDPADRAAEGPIATATWNLAVIDGLTGMPIPSCSAGTEHLECLLPSRAATEGPRAFKIVVSATGLTDLSATLADDVHSMAGLTFTGALPGTRAYVCDFMKVRTVGEVTYRNCLNWSEYAQMIALDHAELELDPITVTVSSAGKVTTLTTEALAWDSGDDDLPGAH